ALAHLVVLSPLDVAFWKLRGIRHVSYLPNPPSPFLLTTGAAREAKSVPFGRRLELVWWGRLEEHTKKVTQLVEVAAALQRLGVDFRLRIVGPDWADMSADRLRALAATRGVA
ncbi:glycosyl transferase family 2, partial [Pseudomonas sp. BGM005]|nr:glycosyl transferase family 2 [Pseudomonas sp. BG5]